MEAFVAAQAPMKRVQRTVALRVIAAYRTVSHTAATLLAKMPPITLFARGRKRIYDRVQDMRRGEVWTESGEERIREEEGILIRRQWKIYMENPRIYGKKTTEVVLPIFNEWLDCDHNETGFRVTQILTEHGCFNSYLKQIGKMQSAPCRECKREEDSARHTMERCMAWEEERAGLVEELEEEVTLDGLLKRMLRNRETWKRVTKFLNIIMEEKGKRERDR